MTNPYILALEEYGDYETTRQALLPFRHYLDNAIKALEKKQVTCRWKPLEEQCWEVYWPYEIYQISPEADWYRLVRDVEEDQLLEKSFIPDFSEPISIGKGKDRTTLTITSQDWRIVSDQLHIRLSNIVGATRIAWAGYLLEVQTLQHFNPETLSSLQGYFWEEGDHYLLITTNKPALEGCNVKHITQEWLSQLTANQFINAQAIPLDPTQWKLQWQTKQKILELTSLTTKQVLATPLVLAKTPTLQLDWQIKPVAEQWIQLLDDDNDDDSSGISKLDYFFSESINIQDSNNKNPHQSYKILKSNKEERQLLLDIISDKSKKTNTIGVLPKHTHLKVKVDIGQLITQKKAIYHLTDRPNLDHVALLDLLYTRDAINWPIFEPVAEQHVDWVILKDIAFDGCDRQREFVCKALASPDFAILDGPPGTGKTTTILELIIQLVRQNKRILLCASTHAAINNVLERISEKKLDNEIFSLRIGDAERATGVEQYQYEQLKNQLDQSLKNAISEQILVDSANLVCGTTMGILRLFNNTQVVLDKGEVPFDVLIIDECSKTTFQEFLVPARFAKRWILVGDIKQLSPFTDRDQITANLDNLVLQPAKKDKPPQTLDNHLQIACFYLHLFYPFRSLVVLPVSKAVAQSLCEEINKRSHNRAFENILVIADLKNTKENFLYSEKVILENLEKLYLANTIFIEQEILDRHFHIIPSDMLVLDSKWLSSAHAFHHATGWQHQHNYRDKGKIYNDAFIIHQLQTEQLTNRNWSAEVCWRLEREYWLRGLKGSNRRMDDLANQLDRLFPKSVSADGRIYQLRNMAFPSILEALAGSGLIKSRIENPTTLNQGFNYQEKYCRHTTLTYQHRMHPDISAFPRERFYMEQGEKISLIDGYFVKSRSRQWQYNRYPKHNCWLDIHGKVYKNRNQKEVEAIIKEVDQFCQWAEGKQTHEGTAYDIALLTFYKGQEAALRDGLQKLTHNKKAYSRFTYRGIAIRLATVDYFQGQEADFVLLSMVNNQRDGFMDSPNRLNVAITRARYQLVIVGDYNYFSRAGQIGTQSDDLYQLAKSMIKI